MAIRVLSFDFDGCLFHEGYLYAQDQDVIKQNQAFFDTINKENKENRYSKTYSIVGSNRQSLRIDENNSRGKGSCFPALQQVSAYLGTVLNKLLLADIYGNLPAGTSFNQALQGMTSHDLGVKDWIFDESKATILYAQMHHFANLHPNEEIVFDFYDDRGLGKRGHVYDILEQLRDFYIKSPHLIPSNVTLRLSHYAGGDVTAIATVKGADKGAGFINSKYRETVQEMAAQCPRDFEGKISAALMVAPNRLTSPQARKADAKVDPDEVSALPLPIPVISAQVIRNFSDVMDVFHSKYRELESKYSILKNDDAASDEKIAQYERAVDKARAIYFTISSKKEDYLHGNISAKDFAQAANQVINDGRKELETHRGWKEVIGNLVIGISTLGIALLANKFFNDKFLFFFKTDSAQKLDKVAIAVQEISAAPVA